MAPECNAYLCYMFKKKRKKEKNKHSIIILHHEGKYNLQHMIRWRTTLTKHSHR